MPECVLRQPQAGPVTPTAAEEERETAATRMPSPAVWVRVDAVPAWATRRHASPRMRSCVHSGNRNRWTIRYLRKRDTGLRPLLLPRERDDARKPGLHAAQPRPDIGDRSFALAVVDVPSGGEP